MEAAISWKRKFHTEDLFNIKNLLQIATQQKGLAFTSNSKNIGEYGELYSQGGKGRYS